MNLYENTDVYIIHIPGKTFTISKAGALNVNMICRETGHKYDIDTESFNRGIKLGLIKTIGGNISEPTNNSEEENNSSNYFSFDDL